MASSAALVEDKAVTPEFPASAESVTSLRETMVFEKVDETISPMGTLSTETDLVTC
jgi:hypothetical protein